jgi:proteic killer suppression protein
MIRSFRDKDTEAIFNGEPVLKFQNIARVARRKLRSIHKARTLRDLSLPGNRLEALKADRSGQHSVRINDQYRVCFVWDKGDAREVEIVDYH